MSSGEYQRLSSYVADLSDAVLSYTYGNCEELAQALGMDCVEVSAHAGCWPDHQPYQGRVYTIAEFEELNSGVIERPIALGVMNCRHEATFCYADDERTYTDEQLDEMAAYSNESVSFTGLSGSTLTMARYEAESYARSTASRIRGLKQTAATEAAAGNPTTAYDTLVARYTESYKRMCEELGITYDADATKAWRITSM